MYLLSVQQVNELQGQVECLQRELEQEVLRREEVWHLGWREGGVRVELNGAVYRLVCKSSLLPRFPPGSVKEL